MNAFGGTSLSLLFAIAMRGVLLLGLGGSLRLLAVCHCVREGGEPIRIISARRAIRAEQTEYWERKNRLDLPTIEFFKTAAEGSGIPYQTLINLYLRDCAEQGRGN